VDQEKETDPGHEEHAGEAEQDELDRQREDGDRGQAEGQDEPGEKVRQAKPEEEAEEQTTEDIDRAFD
jgi:hypothetical protein